MTLIDEVASWSDATPRLLPLRKATRWADRGDLLLGRENKCR